MRNKLAGNAGLWQKIDPAVLLAGAITLSIAVACCTALTGAILSFGIGLAILPLARLSAGKVIKRILAVNFFILPLFLIVPFTSPSPYLWQYGILKLSKSGLDLCILALFKSNAIVMLFLALVGPMSVATFGAALRRLGCPDKLAWMFLLMDCNLHLLGNAWRMISEAAALRGFAPNTSLHTYRTYAAHVAIFFLRAHDRSKTLREAMLLAGFDGRVPFSCSWRFGWQEMLFCIAVFSFSLLILAVI